MKNRLAVGAIVLWMATIAALGFVFIRGNTAAGPDGRTTVLLRAEERDFVLEEMRTLLVAVRDITEAINHDDKASVAAAAHRVGVAEAHDVAPVLMAKLPLDFKQKAMPLHRGFDELAAAAERGEPASALSGMLLEQMDRCIGCHAAFRLDVER